MPTQPPPSIDRFSSAAEDLFRSLLAALGPQQTARASDTSRLAAIQARYLEQQAALLRAMWAGSAGAAAEQVAAADRGDKRFASPEWRRDPWFDYLRRSYLINSQFLSEWVEALDAEPQAKERLRFVARQFADAMSPANFAATNPEALRLALETKGESLARGVRQLVEDVHKGRISTTDESQFEIGRNIAATAGAVVHQNELMQLIQYQPVTESVFKRPLVMIPPCINKYYILDLQRENSLVRFALEQGHSVFMVSWRNVNEDLGHLTWNDYIQKGVLEALGVARAISDVPKVNALGFCVGGTMLGVALAVDAARGERGVESATFLASMLDFSDTGEIGLFVDEATVALREAAIGGGGIMPGRDLALVFSALRANDLVWSHVINNYLKGKTPPAFDLLYWNADSTNLPGPMYCWYVRNAYLENRLREPARASVLGVPVDFGKVAVPAYVLATREDHIVPWRTAYRTTQLIRGDSRFVLGASGHVAGVVNPASGNKRSHWTGAELHAEPDDWFAKAKEAPGSWWTDWSDWLSRFGEGRGKARGRLGDAHFKPLQPAPGSYVRQRIV